MPLADQLDISTDGADGAGRDPSLGARAVRAHQRTIVDAVNKRLAGADALVLMAGLGGGTGSAVAELIDVLLPLERPILVVATLPSDGESGIAKVNAARAVDAIVRANVAGTFFVDNGRLLEAFPGLDVVSFFQKVNARILQPLDELNRHSAREDAAALRAFDGEDLRRALLSSGTLSIHTARLPDGVLAAADLMDVVDKAADGGDFLAKGGSLDAVAYAAVVVTGPEKALKTTPMQVFEELSAELKKRTLGAAVIDGLSVGPDDQPLRCTVLLSSLGLPKRVTGLVDKAAAEGAALAKKIARDVPPLDTGVLDGLTLFRGARGAGSLPPTPAAAAGPSTSAPARAPAAAPVAAPVAVDSTSLPPTAVRPAAAPAPAPKKATVVTEILPGGSNLPSLPDNLMLPPPIEAELGPRAKASVSDEMTMEGEGDLSPAPLPSLPSMTFTGATAAQRAELDDAVTNYRAGDKKVKERIGRKWLEDSRAADTQVRLLAVIGMVEVKDGAFRRALTRCSADDDTEVAQLAIKGLDALGDVPGVE